MHKNAINLVIATILMVAKIDRSPVDGGRGQCKNFQVIQADAAVNCRFTSVTSTASNTDLIRTIKNDLLLLNRLLRLLLIRCAIVSM